MVTWTSELHLNAPCACLRKTWHFLHWFNSILKVINASPTVREACTSVTVQSTRAASMFLFLPPTFWSHPWPLSFFSDYNPSEVEILFGLRLGNGLAGCAGYLRFSKNSHSCLSNKNREEKNKKKTPACLLFHRRGGRTCCHATEMGSFFSPFSSLQAEDLPTSLPPASSLSVPQTHRDIHTTIQTSPSCLLSCWTEESRWLFSYCWMAAAENHVAAALQHIVLLWPTPPLLVNRNTFHPHLHVFTQTTAMVYNPLPN